MAATRRSMIGGLAALVTGTAHAQPAPRPLTQDRLRAIRLRAGSPALAAAAQRGTDAPHLWADGQRVEGADIPVAPHDLWHIGSITKSMTATLIARLIEAGQLHWDDTVGEALSAVAPDMRPQYRAATFRHLLSHRSGMPHNVSLIDYVRYQRLNPDPRAERADYARRSLAMAPEGPIATTFHYSNNGYVVAGAMTEARTGASWEELMRRHVFAPLSMISAGFGAPGISGRLDQPVGHMADLIGGGLHPVRIEGGDADNPAAMGPCGGVHCSLADMIRYLGAHRDRSDFLQPESWDILHTPPFGGDYAMGWFVRSNGVIQHGGWNRRWMSLALFDRRYDLSAFAVTNDGRADRTDPEINTTILEAGLAARS